MVALAGVLWGCIGIFVRKLSLYHMTSMEIVEIRALTTVIFLTPVIFIKDKRLFMFHLKDIWVFLGTGLCSIVFFNYCYFLSIEMLSLSAAAVLLYTAPSFVMVLSFIIFHESFTLRKVIALILTFCGCALVTGLGGGGRFSLAGLVVGLGSGLGYALYSIFGRFAINKKYKSLTITYYTFAFAFLGTLFMQNQSRLFSAFLSSPSLVGYGACLGGVSTVLPFLLYTIGLGTMENGQASVIASIEPVVASILGIVLFHENGTWQNVLGVVLVITGIVTCNIKPVRKVACGHQT